VRPKTKPTVMNDKSDKIVATHFPDFLIVTSCRS
jgi:hypothetical protein